MSDLKRYVGDKLRSRNTYIVAAIVGSFINLYGHFLVPTLRGELHPLDRFVVEFASAPGVVFCSILLAYIFPLCVGVYSSVATRFQTRGFERRSWFPDHKPDPVFRASSEGEIADCGSKTKSFLDRYGIKRAQDILGDEAWEQIVEQSAPNDEPITIYFEADQKTYSVVYSTAPNGDINVYMTPA